MKRPLIGVTSSGEENTLMLKNPYFDALWECGCTPVALPNNIKKGQVEEYARLFDGFLFTGGVDVDPVCYREEVSPLCGEIQPWRDRFELSLLKEVLPAGKPCLGICRGVQLMNVGMGGSLYQHVEGHVQQERDALMHHTVYIEADSLLDKIIGKAELGVNSFHHQMIKKVGKSLKSCAFLPDGKVEAVYLPGHRFFLGVQWHPEITQERDTDARSIFTAFIKACLEE